jgi:protein-disulfide isomerase
MIKHKGQNQGKRKADSISDNKGASHAGNHTSSTKITRFFEGMCPACKKATFDFKPSGVDVSEFNTPRE